MAKKRSRPLIPVDYYMAVSDKIHKMNPSRDIVFNCIKEVGCDSFSRGYLRRIEDSRVFKDRQKQQFNEYWNGLKDYIDDVIHCRVEPKTNKA